MNVEINIETVASSLSIAWATADQHDTHEMRIHCWSNIRSKISGLQKIVIYGTDKYGEDYEELKDDLRILSLVAFERFMMA